MGPINCAPNPCVCVGRTRCTVVQHNTNGVFANQSGRHEQNNQHNEI